MTGRETYEAGGFAFSDESTREKALKEAEGIRYLKGHTDMNRPEMVLQMYSQLIEQRLFETPVGYVFLYELQEYLSANPSVPREEIPAIPVAEVREPVREPKKKEKKRTEEKKQTGSAGRTKVSHIDFKSRFRTSLSINIILLLIVIGMFAVTATSDNINVINYENALIEKYENWESELKEREETLREREENLNRTNGTEEAFGENGTISLDE